MKDVYQVWFADWGHHNLLGTYHDEAEAEVRRIGAQIKFDEHLKLNFGKHGYVEPEIYIVKIEVGQDLIQDWEKE